MDWYLEPGDAGAVPELRRAVVGYLARHASADSDLAAAEIVVAELLANAVEHAAGPAWVSIRWDDVRPVLAVTDLGPGFERGHGSADPSSGSAPGTGGPAAGGDAVLQSTALPADPFAEGGRGLFLVDHLSHDLDIAARRSRGTTISATLDVRRRPGVHVRAPRRNTAALPAIEEALPEGGFARETFLNAIVVQLAQSVELLQGPEAADAVLTQVGADVGGRIEEEYRAARAVRDPLTPRQIGECLVRFKAALDGAFSVESVDEHKVVLVNSRCPFGAAVQRMPALCRMTASVFGAIAARNAAGGESAVLLEERIALGDPGCRIVVWLDPDEGAPAAAHRYRSAV